MQGYSSESPESELAFKINLEGYRSSITCVYEGDEGCAELNKIGLYIVEKYYMEPFALHIGFH